MEHLISQRGKMVQLLEIIRELELGAGLLLGIRQKIDI
jgi:hypothetical protein